MPILRLAYTTQFILALIAVFFLWSEVGGQSHLDLMPWYLKLGLGAGAAYAAVKATAAAVARDAAWNGTTLRWVGIMLALLLTCGLASYYYHLYGEEDDDQNGGSDSSVALVGDGLGHGIRLRRGVGHRGTETRRFWVREFQMRGFLKTLRVRSHIEFRCGRRGSGRFATPRRNVSATCADTLPSTGWNEPLSFDNRLSEFT